MRLYAKHVRSILLKIEENQKMGQELTDADFQTFDIYSDISRNQFAYTLQKLNEAEYIKAKFDLGDDESQRITVNEITFSGHKFLDTVRDDGIRKDTKAVLSRLLSTPISIIKTVATSVLPSYAKIKDFFTKNVAPKVLPFLLVSGIGAILILISLHSMEYYLSLPLTGIAISYLVLFATIAVDCFVILAKDGNISKPVQQFSYLIAGLVTIAYTVFSVLNATNGQVNELLSELKNSDNGISPIDSLVALLVYTLGLTQLLPLTVKSAWKLFTNLIFTIED